MASERPLPSRRPRGRDASLALGPRRRPRATRLALCTGCGLLLAAAARGESRVATLPLSEDLSWPTSAAWYRGPDGPALLVTDVGRPAVYLFVVSVSAGDKAAVSPARLELPDRVRLRHPSILRASGDTLFLKDEPSYEDPVPRILLFDRSLQSRGEFRDLADARLEGGAEVRNLYELAPWRDGVLAVVRAERGGKEDLALAFLGREGEGRALEWLPADGWHHYLHNRGYLAALPQSGGFFLDLAGGPDLKRVDPTAAGVAPPVVLEAAVPEAFRHRPALEQSAAWKREWDRRYSGGASGRRRAFIYYDLLEKTSTTGSLVTWQDRLFLVTKGAAAPDGRTPWWLVEIQPATGEPLARLRLPAVVDAAHLVVAAPAPEVPGSQWALIERLAVGQRVDGAPTFLARSLVLISPELIANPPPEWTEAPSAPLATAIGRR